MDTLSGFWAGAVELAGREELRIDGSTSEVHALAERCGGWSRLPRLSAEELEERGASEAVVRALTRSQPLQTIGRAVTLGSPEYPTSLLSWSPGGPPALLVEGAIAALSRPTVAVVGTRGCSPYGASVAHRIAWACAREGITVVSGLARGIDTHAHQGALAAGGLTVAVLGHGLLHTAPPSNRGLRRRIVESGGAMVSTWPDPVPPSKRTFPLRNQWIAALAQAVVVVEAPARSGALHTANVRLYPATVDRDHAVWVVPGPFGAPGWEGSMELVRHGAHVLLDLEPLLERLVGSRPTAERFPDWLAAVLTSGDLGEAARLAGTSTIDVLRELTRLELAGRVVRLPGGRYAPAGGGPCARSTP